MAKKSKLSILTNGIIKENPVLVLLNRYLPDAGNIFFPVQWSAERVSPQQQY